MSTPADDALTFLAELAGRAITITPSMRQVVDEMAEEGLCCEANSPADLLAAIEERASQL